MTETETTDPAGLLHRTLFRVDDDPFNRADVILWALLVGDWQQLRADVCAGLACRAHQEVGLTDLDDAAVKDAANEFRYNHKLLSADETRTWLGAREVSPAEWMEYIRRTLLRVQLHDQLTKIVASHPIADDEVLACVMAEAFCSGRLDEFARALAGRAALHAGVGPSDEATEKLDTRATVVDPAEAAQLGLTLADQTRVPLIQRIEATYRQRCEELQTPQAIVAQVRENRLDWIHLQLALAHFDDESSAEEAVFCVRDGMTLAEVALSAGVRLERLDTYLEDVQADLRDRLVGAGKGDVLGPLASSDRFAVIVVEDKVLPDGNDPKLAQKARESLLAAILARATHERVTWESEL